MPAKRYANLFSLPQLTSPVASSTHYSHPISLFQSPWTPAIPEMHSSFMTFLFILFICLELPSPSYSVYLYSSSKTRRNITSLCKVVNCSSPSPGILGLCLREHIHFVLCLCSYHFTPTSVGILRMVTMSFISVSCIN